MRNVYEVLREKENAIERVRREVEALRSAASLLANQKHARSNISTRPADYQQVSTETFSEPKEAVDTVEPLVADEMEDVLAKIRARLIEAAENESKLGRSKRISRHLRQIAAPLLNLNVR